MLLQWPANDRNFITTKDPGPAKTIYSIRDCVPPHIYLTLSVFKLFYQELLDPECLQSKILDRRTGEIIAAHRQFKQGSNK